MRIRAILTASLTLLSACAGSRPAARDAAPALEPRPVATGLQVPWSLAFAPDGRLFVTERPGRIRIVERDSLRAEPWATIPVHANEEAGLMGIAIDPEFARNGRVYVCYTAPAGNAGTNRIAVLTEEGGKGGAPRVLVDGIPAGSFHDGCRLGFGPDGKLYATTGDAYLRETAQSLGSLAGKVLRLNADGSVPADNPFPGSYVWTYGHRNPQGLAWHPDGRLLATEHGTGGDGNNELNVIEKGWNYGWPDAIGYTTDPRLAGPILVNGDAPAGATFVTSDRYPALRGGLLIAALSSQRLYRVAFQPDSTLTVAGTETVLYGLGRIRDVVQGPDGFLYVATSNRDGRGQPGPDDDRVLRLVPR
jgi:glucose/arabinose dehydrogenase